MSEHRQAFSGSPGPKREEAANDDERDGRDVRDDDEVGAEPHPAG
jgi:hypothetical protein